MPLHGRTLGWIRARGTTRVTDGCKHPPLAKIGNLVSWSYGRFRLCNSTSLPFIWTVKGSRESNLRHSCCDTPLFFIRYGWLMAIKNKVYLCIKIFSVVFFFFIETIKNKNNQSFSSLLKCWNLLEWYIFVCLLSVSKYCKLSN